MLLTERRPASTDQSSPFVTTGSPSPFSGANRQTYFRLRMALGIRLRRQVFFAVCDDVALRSQLTQWLVNDLSQDPLPEMDTIANEPAFDQTQSRTQAPGIRLVTLTLHADQPDLQKQIAEWLAHRRGRVDRSQIAFQIVGIDSLTRQSATVQRQFINSLRALGRHYAQWNLNLVLWVTKPWFHSIRQSAPEFWRCYTGIFDFTAPAPNSETQCSEDDGLSSHPLTPLAALAETVRFNGLTQVFMAEWLPESLSVSSDLTLSETIHNLALLHQESADDTTLAMAYRTLGNHYRDQTSPTDATFSLGIRAYQEALQRESQRSPTNNPLVADLLNDLGTLYWMRSRQQSDSNQQCQDLETAVDHYQKAVAHTDEIQEPERYIILQNNLGSIWGELAQNVDPETYLPRSIAAYESSLKVQNVQTASQEGQRRANTANNLGTAYWTLAQYQKKQAPSLQKAIAHYSTALEFYDVETYSMAHAMIQNNLGTAFWNLSQCETLGHYSHENSQDLLIHAITAYKVALLYRTPEALPLGHAATQNNLGTAYWNLATDRLTHSDEIGDLIQLTIVSYQASLTMVEALIASGSVNFSFDPFATHYNLATAFNSSVKYVTTDHHTEHHNVIHKAFTHYLIAWQGWQNQPDQATPAINGLVQVLRTAYDRLGREVQSKLLSSLPPQLLTVVIPKV